MHCISPLSIKDPYGTTNAVRLTVPCGKCGICLHNRRIDWSFRLSQETNASISSWFITLTYKQEELPIINGIQTLQKRDLQLFLKRIRKNHTKYNLKPQTASLYMPPIRFYAVGEYGPRTDRPHYHALVYNMHYETACRLDKIWKKGQIQMGIVTPATIHYVTKFHVNTKSKPELIDEETGELIKEETVRQKEFALMSRKPGIGHQYIDKIGKWHMQNDANYVLNSGYKQKIPRYYKGKVVPKRLEKQQLTDMLKESDEKYERELVRLERLKVQNPSVYQENALYHKSLQILKENKNQLTL